MQKVLVIGSNSFSGQDFIDLLLDDDDLEVIGVSRSIQKEGLFLRYSERSELSRFRFERFDLNLNIDAFLAFMDAEKPSWIVNFAAQSEVGPSWDHPDQWFQTNCTALACILKHISENDYVERYLHISSPEVYGSCVGTITEQSPMNPSTPYAASKAAADMLLKVYEQHQGLPLMSVRATNVYGARQQLFKIIMRSAIYIRLGRKIPLHGGGHAVKSYIHVRDVSRGEYAVLKRGEIGRIYHLSPPSGISVRDVVSRIAEQMGYSLEEVAFNVDERIGQDAVYEIDSSAARNELGWASEIELETGFNEVVEWVERHWEHIKDLPHDYVHKP